MDGKTSTMEGTRVEPEHGGMAELYVRYVPAGIRLAYLLTGDRHQAEDLAHEAFVRCVGRFTYLRSREAFDALPPTGDREPPHVGDPAPLRRARVAPDRGPARRRRPRRRCPTSSAARICGERSATLPARQRAALVLRYYEDLSERDTATVLGCSVAAVKSLVARGSDGLRALIAEGDER